MKHLKFVQKGYERYSGPIGKYTFVDGISTEAIHRVDRDTLSTAFQFVEIDEDGTETPAGVAHRLVKDSAARFSHPGPLKRQTDAERLVENTKIQAGKGKAPPELHTRAQLETIAEKHGLKGLRSQVGDKWGVQDRSINLLIDKILAAQAEVLEKRQERIAPPAEKPAAPASNTPSATIELGSDDAALKAAASGDLGAALNQSAQNAETDQDPAASDTDALAGAEDPASLGKSLIGSSVLASTYEIGGSCVTLGSIVLSAFTRFKGTADEWNKLPNEQREELLRLDLDQRLAEV